MNRCLFLIVFSCSVSSYISTLSLHDALPISQDGQPVAGGRAHGQRGRGGVVADREVARRHVAGAVHAGRAHGAGALRSEEHTSELQSRRDLVCRLLLEKKKVSLSVLS